MLKSFLKAVFKKPIAVLMLFLFVVSLGGIAIRRTNVSLLPDVTYPGISVKALYPGESSRRIEQDVTIPLERALGSLGKVQGIQSSSSRGKAEINVKFALDTNMERKMLEVRERLKRVRGELPEQLQSLSARKFSSNDMPVLISAFTSSGLSPERIRKIVDKELKPKIQRLDGVANVRVVGGRKEKFLVNLSPSRLSAHQLSIKRVAGQIIQSNYYRPFARVDRGTKKVPLRQERLQATESSLSGLPVGKTGNAGLLTIGELGTVERGYLESSTISRVNGLPSVAIYVFKSSQSNLLSVSRRVRRIVDNFETASLKKHFVFDQAEPVERSFDSLRNAVILGALAAAFVLFLFLRNAWLLGVVLSVIPVSIMIVIALLYASPFSLNVITLSGIALGVGMLVDSAVVIAENVQRVNQREEDHLLSSVLGTSQMVPPLVASVLTTIVVFLPLLFVSSEIKQMYMGFAYTVSAALVASLIVSCLLVPVLMSFVDVGEVNRIDWLSRWVTGTMESMYQHRMKVLVGVIAFVVMSLPLITVLGEELGSQFSSRSISVSVEMEPGTPLAQSRRILNEMEDSIQDKPYVKTFSTKFERWNGDINIQLRPRALYDITNPEAIDDLQAALKPFRKRGAQIYFKQKSQGGGNRIRLELSGPSISRLRSLSSEYVKLLKTMKQLDDVHVVMPRPRPVLNLELQLDKLNQYGVRPQTVLNTLRSKIGGKIATRLRDGGQQYDVIFRLARTNINSFEDLKTLTVTGRKKTRYNLRGFTNAVQSTIGSKIQRKDGQRASFIVARVQGADLRYVFEQIKQRINSVQLPEGYFFRLGDQYEKLTQMRTNMTWVLILTFVLIYLVMMGVLESLWQPFLIIFSVPAALGGSLLMLAATGESLSLSTYIGMVMLMGLVVNSAIVLVNQMENEKRRRSSIKEAVHEALSQRVQPVLMTSLTTVFALAPLLITTSSGSAISAPLALTVISGLLSGVTFNLFVIPLLYRFVEEWKSSLLDGRTLF
jgi:HAE1 family hydrophobic/amphiphilic exporter-1